MGVGRANHARRPPATGRGLGSWHEVQARRLHRLDGHRGLQDHRWPRLAQSRLRARPEPPRIRRRRRRAVRGCRQDRSTPSTARPGRRPVRSARHRGHPKHASRRSQHSRRAPRRHAPRRAAHPAAPLPALRRRRAQWVLKRLRIHQAAEQLTATSPPPWTELALDLGYYDHAHFIRDFRLVVGRSPAEYAAEAARAREDQNPASRCQSASRSA